MRNIKYVFAFMFTFVLLCSLCSCAEQDVASKEYDSLTFNEHDLEILKDIDAVTPIKVYNSSLTAHFHLDGKECVVNGLIEKLEDGIYYRYLNKPSGSDCQWYYVDSGKLNAYNTKMYETGNFFYKYALNPSQVFGTFAEVYNVYCFDSTSTTGDAAIYYITDKGDYVLYKQNFVSEWDDADAYLFPTEDFRAFSNAVINHHSTKDGELDKYGIVPSEDIYDMSPYLLRDSYFKSLIAESAAAILAVGAVVTVLAVKRRRKKPATASTEV